MSSSTAERKSGIELLRIIAMFAIVYSHILSRSNLSLPFNNGLPEIINYLFVYSSFGGIAVDIFFIIFGYFNINKKFSIKRIIKLETQAIFYGLTIYLLLIIFKQQAFDVKTLLICFVPTVTGQWWFLTAYILVYVLSPLVNLVISKMNIKLLSTLDILVILGCITLVIVGHSSTIVTITDCFAMYILGSILKITNYSPSKKTCFITMCIITIIVYLCIILVANRKGFAIIPSIMDKLLYRTSPFSVLIATYSFLLFLNMNFKSVIINRIASSIFAVYLIHDNRMLRNTIIQIVNLSKYQNKTLMILYLLVGCVAIILFCFMIESIRKKVSHFARRKVIKQ